MATAACLLSRHCLWRSNLVDKERLPAWTHRQECQGMVRQVRSSQSARAMRCDCRACLVSLTWSSAAFCCAVEWHACACQAACAPMRRPAGQHFTLPACTSKRHNDSAVHLAMHCGRLACKTASCAATTFAVHAGRNCTAHKPHPQHARIVAPSICRPQWPLWSLISKPFPQRRLLWPCQHLSRQQRRRIQLQGRAC